MKGYVFAALAAALYGTNPVFAAPLYATGMNSLSVVLCRYFCGLPLLAALIFIFREKLHLQRREISLLALLGVIMAFSSWALYESYNLINPGVASTLLFVYPVLTALIMILFFHEPFRWPIGASLCIMLPGLYLLGSPGGAEGLNFAGLVLVMLSAFAYSIYLVLIKVCPSVGKVPACQSLFWQLLFGTLLYVAIAVSGVNFVPPAKPIQWGLVAGIAIFPTLLSLLCTLKAVALVGPTATAIFGALEPVTAVGLSWLILGEKLTLPEIAGAALIVAATIIVAALPAHRA